jgi:hypothetical protein
MESRQVHSEEPMNLLWLNLLHVYDGEQNLFLFSAGDDGEAVLLC